MEKNYITVTSLNNYLKHSFDSDENLRRVYLKGEISNYKAHTRGHLYFTLKDEDSRINAVLFSFNAGKLTFEPEDGQKVLITGKVSVYPTTGSYQIYVEEMEPDGLGNLYLQYEALKKELAQKGLFAESHKLSLPKYPSKIGIITASTGAAVKDILSTIKRRYPICETILFPCLVQGSLAKDDIARQIKNASEYDLDLIIVGRGGGSIEDLWAFNESEVAYAIYECKIPIISAVGHEIDYTIADYVADKRAPTPTGAAEIAVPNITDISILINQYQIRATQVVKKHINHNVNRLKMIKNNYVLQNPLATYEIKEQKLSYLMITLNQSIMNKINDSINKFKVIKANYILNNPLELLRTKKHLYSLILNKLELLNPLSILNKGYSVASIEDKVLKNANDVKIGDKLKIKLAIDEIEAKVERIIKNGKEKI